MSQSNGFRIGTIAGAPVRMTTGFLGVTALLYLSGAAAPGWIVALAWLPMVAGSVLAHEAGHALVAAANAQKVEEIALTWHGGHMMRRGLPLPQVDFRVALAGPAASLALAALAFMVSLFPLGPVAAIAGNLAGLNLMWGLFNLIPIAPLDGGHALSALARMRR